MKIGTWGAIAALLVAAVLLSDAPDLLAQAPVQAPSAYLYRPLMRLPFRNVGVPTSSVTL